MCGFILSACYQRKKIEKSFFRSCPIMPANVRYNTPPIHQGGSDLPIKCRRFSNFEFLLEHCIGIVEKNISTKFGEYPTNCSEITTKKVLSVFCP